MIEAALDAGIHYVDMNDDHEVAEAVLLDPLWAERARSAGVTLLLDCGVVPGLSGMLVRHAADQLGSIDRVAVRFAWNYSHEYPAALHHFFRINSGEGPQLIDGELVRMAPFAGREEVGFGTPVYFTGIPDPVAVSHFVPGVREATAKGAFFQEEANRLLEELIRSGLAPAGLGRDPSPRGAARRARRGRWAGLRGLRPQPAREHFVHGAGGAGGAARRARAGRVDT